MSEDVTSVQVHHDTWKSLHRLKGPGDSMDDVIQMLLAEEADETDEDETNHARAEG